MLSAHDIHLSLNGHRILNGVSAHLQSGRVTAVLGPNGAGKSSLLKVLSGEWIANRGEVRLDQSPLSSYSVAELGRRRAFLHQESQLGFAFTAFEVVLLGRSPHMLDGERPVDHERARAALNRVDLADRADDLYTRLSGGEKQRVHLARVLAQIDAPDISGRWLFLDEPTNNLDPEHRQLVLRIARDSAAGGVGVCMVLHDLNDAIETADDILLLHHGEIVFSGSPADFAQSDLLESVFRVRIQRIQVPGRTLPFLAFSQW